MIPVAVEPKFINGLTRVPTLFNLLRLLLNRPQNSSRVTFLSHFSISEVLEFMNKFSSDAHFCPQGSSSSPSPTS
jgi:hypothetical protein